MSEEITPIRIAVADDHRLFRSGLINLIHSLGEEFKVIIEAVNGKELLSLLKVNKTKPDIALVDVNMPQMDGFETAAALQREFPDVSVLIITMVEEEETLIKMLRLGVKGYLSKDVEPEEIKRALIEIANKGYYYTDYVTGKLIEAVRIPVAKRPDSSYLKEREQRFLELACTEYTYKEIADIMCVSHKTVDGYRNSLFEKLGVKSRVGMVMYALKNKLVEQ